MREGIDIGRTFFGMFYQYRTYTFLSKQIHGYILGQIAFLPTWTGVVSFILRKQSVMSASLADRKVLDIQAPFILYSNLCFLMSPLLRNSANRKLDQSQTLHDQATFKRGRSCIVLSYNAILTEITLGDNKYQSYRKIDKIDLSNIAKMQNDPHFSASYTFSDTKITLEQPGLRRSLPEYVMKEIRELFPNMKKYESFLGGHPVSITRSSFTEIFPPNNSKQSPYLVCEKSDGVRYLLIVSKVFKADLIRTPAFDQPYYTQCYFVSRKGHSTLQSFVVDVSISLDMDVASTQLKESDRRHVVSILDGELVQQFVKEKQIFRYLMFDGLVHLGRNICKLPLKQRLDCVNRFVQCNEMLGKPFHKIGIELKDFFRLTCRKFNVMQFMLKKYVKMMEHNYDGIIFNHEEKEYIVGATNNGYIKWKPQELNTVDFVIVPNTNLEDKYGRRVLDLYVGYSDPALNRYVRLFYAFTVIDEAGFGQLENVIRQKQEERYRMSQEKQVNGDYTAIDEFNGVVIAECRYETTKGNQRVIMSQLTREPAEDLRSNLMKQGDQDKDLKSIEAVKKQIYDKNWKIYKIREDKSLPNNVDTVKKIEDSIRDGISFEELLRKGKQINEKLFK